MSSHKKKHSVEEGESPIGFVMFGDLMSQLLCFFILLFVFASQFTAKNEGSTYEDLLKKISESFKKSVNEKSVTKVVSPKTPQKDTAADKKEDKVEIKIAKEIKQIINDEKLTEYADVIIEEQKVRIVLQQPILFDSGQAELKVSAPEILSLIGQVIMKTKNPIDIEGHTDSDPIHTDKYDSNWDLSFARSYAVIKYFVKNVGLSPLNMHAIGYGEYRPIAPNDSLQNKAKNRRIEINLYFKEGVKLKVVENKTTS